MESKPGNKITFNIRDFLMLRALRESGGTAVAVDDKEILQWMKTGSAMTGIFFCPEGAAAIAATIHLLKSGWLKPDERVVIFNTGSGLKYAELIQ